MAKMTYAEQLRHPNWQKRRLERLDASGWECQNCGEKQVTLHVHHRRYVKGRMAWEYDDIELAVLCEECHESEHESHRILDAVLATSESYGTDICTGLMAGYLSADCSIDPDLADEAGAGREPYFELGVAAYLLELCGVDAWRDVVRSIAKTRQVPPTVQHLMEQWDHWEARSKARKLGAE